MYRFYLSEDEIIKLHEWSSNHECQFTYDPEKHQFPPTGAIGGGRTYSFTPTGLGVVAKVKCACGEEEDLTDYESW